PPQPATAESTEQEVRMFNEAVDRFFEEMKDPAFDDQTVKGLIANIKATGVSYVRQKGAAYAMVWVLSEAADLGILGFALVTGNIPLFTLFSTVPFQTTFVAG